MASPESSGDPYIGSTISLISKSEIRYEGVLYVLNVHDSTIGLRNVKSYGTEGRQKDGPQVPALDKVYDFILFRGSDIKDLKVTSPAPAQEAQIPRDDPAIIQSHYAGAPESSPQSAALVGGRILPEITQWQDTPSLSGKSNNSVLPSYHSANEVGPSGHSFSSQISATPELSFSPYWQGYNRESLNMPQQPHHMQTQYAILNQNKAHEIQTSLATGSADTSAHLIPAVSSSTSISLNPNFPSLLTSVKYFSALDMPSSLATQMSLPSNSMPVNAGQLNMPSLSSFGQDWNSRETQYFSTATSEPIPVLPLQSMPYPVSSSMVFDGSSSRTLPQSLITPDQFAPSRAPILSAAQKLYLDQKNIGAMVPTPSSSSAPPVTQAPLLPLPTSQSQYSNNQFSEEFDFIAMNEKFKKDEVWGDLGKGKQRDETVRGDVSVIGQSLDDKEGSTKTAYNKDEFFDTISCNSLNRGARNGQRFSERPRTDSEGFGNFQQRSNDGYGPGPGAGRGGNYRGYYQSGRGYGYGSRGRGGNMPKWW